MPDTFDLVVRVFTVPIAVLFLINGLDDLFVDLNYFILGLWRRRLALTVEKLKAVPQKRIALLVPAWREAAVIEKMLENTMSTLDYDPSRFDVFVGTYANDLETQACVDAVCARTPNVVKVVVPHDGPTCKADCLNWVYQGILLAENRRGIRYDILLLHDSEDVVHPLELRLHNYHIPAYDFVQTPVLPLEVPWYSFFGGTYLDDFAETHLKDMIVRARIGGLVPSAGVGSGFARDAFEEISVANRQEAFDPSSLTEDYEIGLKFRLAGKKTLFACEAITRSTIELDKRGREHRRDRQEFIATREFFPTSFAATVKQRSRWILGIEFQSWEKIGWKGSLAVLYCLWRDRKAMLSHIGNMVGYLIVTYALTRLAIGGVTGHPWSFGNIFPLGSFLWWCLMANLVLLAWRWAMRFATVQRIYGPLHGVLSLVRMPIGNVINFAALLRATYQWVQHKISKQPLRWASTSHEFPTTSALSAFHSRLGELLVNREGLSRDDLTRALALQERTGEPLGEVLTLSGVMSGWQLVRALGAQWSIPVVEPDPALAPLSLLDRLPEAEADELNVLPAALGDDGIATVISARPLQMDEKARLEARLGARIRIACAPEAAIRHARARAYRRDPGEHAQRLGERLVALGILTPEALTRALEMQRESHELLGELLVREGLVPPEEIARAGQGTLHGGFRALKPDDCDPDALVEIGYGFCALHTLVPLRGRDGVLEVASAFPLHADTIRVLSARGRRKTHIVLAPATDVLLGLHLAAQSAWPNGIAAGVGGADGAELDAAQRLLRLDDADLNRAVVAARLAGVAPIDHLSQTGAVTPLQYMWLLARAYGLSDAPETAHMAGNTTLPPSLVAAHGLSVLRAGVEGITIATARPRPELARHIASLFPDRPVAWRLKPASVVRKESISHEHRSVVPAA